MPAKPPKVAPSVASKLQALGALLRKHRKALGVSATMAAESAGMSRITWYRIEQGNPAVTLGAYMQALSVLGLDLEARPVGKTPAQARSTESIPVRITLADYPQLQQLAWHVRGANTFALSPREALDIYERHGRHLNTAELSQEERELLTALQMALGSAHAI